MSRRFTTFFELLLLMAVVLSLGLGVNWNNQTSVQATQSHSSVAEQPVAQATPASGEPAIAQGETPAAPGDSATPAPDATLTGAEALTSTGVLTGPIQPLATSSVFSNEIALDEGDAPLLMQAPGTINILLLGSDAAVDARYARTDTILVASINPDMPSVSLLSLPRDLQVRIPEHPDDRINTAYELGYIRNYPGGGPAFLAAVLRKNFGIKINHYVRVDFAGLIKAVDTVGGIDVLVECELHDTFPDRSSPSGTIDLDVYPGKVSLSGKQALMYARSRWSTNDFDRARRQQKVLRALLSKVKNSNLLQNAPGLFMDFQENVDTDLGLTSIPLLVDIATRLDDLAIKNRVVTYPVLKAFTRNDGAMVLLPTADTIPYIAEALSPPAGNRAQSRVRVEVYNASGRDDMELVASERLNWEGFAVMASGAITETGTLPNTQIVDFNVTPKGSPIPRLAGIFNVGRDNIFTQGDPSSLTAARIVLGEDYNSCPSTASMAGDVPLAPATNLIPTSTPGE